MSFATPWASLRVPVPSAERRLATDLTLTMRLRSLSLKVHLRMALVPAVGGRREISIILPLLWPGRRGRDYGFFAFYMHPGGVLRLLPIPAVGPAFLYISFRISKLASQIDTGGLSLVDTVGVSLTQVASLWLTQLASL